MNRQTRHSLVAVSLVTRELGSLELVDGRQRACASNKLMCHGSTVCVNNGGEVSYSSLFPKLRWL
jgi:hypothetical protein